MSEDSIGLKVELARALEELVDPRPRRQVAEISRILREDFEDPADVSEW